MDSSVEELCSLIDPFCPAAVSAKGVSQGNNPTVAFQAKQIVQLSTGTTGWGGFTFANGNCRQVYRAQTYSTDATAVTEGNWIPNTTLAILESAITATGKSNIRVNSVGLRWHDVAPLTGTGGVVIASLVPDLAALADANYTIDATAPLPGARSVILDRRKPGSVILNPIDEKAEQFNFVFQDWTNLVAAASPDAFPWFEGIFLSFSGAASTAVLSLEIVINYEVQVRVDLFAGRYAQTTKRSPAFNEYIRAARENIKSFYSENSEQINMYVKKAAKAVLSYYAPGYGKAMLTAGTAVMRLTN
jgi:hypothetical protein